MTTVWTFEKLQSSGEIDINVKKYDSRQNVICPII